ncbi:peptidoglycan-binding protein [Lusitaniella coriacea LEGE 07157]|uniref:Peptidoglycan-binding protein n=1 Tax=Lusitaniella coriacea LEGE 07157 TaxID=945747 RepID=A0A8J7ANP7_9CYAN|nr:peptidoglycan-binding protein [Lusitaniella coriacea]MBE9115083.1 peptidoglycan-binding protein [Lusitaniella coriacea LEGE 07157]
MEALAYCQLALSYEAEVGGDIPADGSAQSEILKRKHNNYLLGFTLALSVLGTTGEAFALIKQGDRGSEVKAVQTRLQQLGYFNANTTGYFGTITQASIIRFQRENGLTPDGIVGPKTQAMLDRVQSQSSARSSLRQGDRGEAVRSLQERLGIVGLFHSTPNGIFDLETDRAVKQFQEERGLTVDGIAGKQTQAALPPVGGSKPKTQEIAQTPEVTYLGEGSQGSGVRSLQQRLRGLGYYNGAVNGIFDRATKNAVIRFQEAQGLKPDGVVGPRTFALLGTAASARQAQPSQTRPTEPEVNYLGQGSQGPGVRSLQQRLRALGHYQDEVTGIYDVNTQEAVMRFQQAQGLRVDGVVGPRTLAVLGDAARNRQTARSAPSNTVVRAPSNPNGLSSQRVKDLQQRLQAQGFYNGPIDGIWGPQTQTALENAQRVYGVDSDDIMNNAL